MNSARIAAVVLASGQSTRFETGEKLLAKFRGRPLAAYAAYAVRDAGFSHSFAVIADGDIALNTLFEAANFTVLPNKTPAIGQGASLAIGVCAAMAAPVDAVLVSLADMPFVTSEDLLSLCRVIGDAGAAVSVSEGCRMPPVLFARQAFNQLSQLHDDEGGKHVLRGLQTVIEAPLPVSSAVDINTADDIARYNNNSFGSD